MLNNIKKTIAYARRNGVSDAIVATAERLRDRRNDNYTYVPPTEEELTKQLKWYRALLNDPAKSKMLPFISILVPCYNTDKHFLKDMIDSVKNQTYGKWELILAEAPVTKTNESGKQVKIYPLTDWIKKCSVGDGRIRYLKLKDNAGISENTNGALDIARGDYIALLDHDDLLTRDALCEMAIAAIKNYPKLIYSNEDKCDYEGKNFFQCHKKPSFNPDMFLSNNYICHFTMLRSDVIFGCRFRSEYDGAQDYDLFLRAIGDTMWSKDSKKQVVHISKVLYHWRMHDNSTSANPASKSYAYEAGRRALRDFMNSQGINAEVEHLKHVGFYRVVYKSDPFVERKDLGVIGGKIVDARGTLVGGNYKENGNVRYEGLPKGFSGGYQHLAVLQQEADAVDVRCMKIRPELYGLYQAVFGMNYVDTTTEGTTVIAAQGLGDESEIKEKCIEFGKRVRRLGYHIMWDPELSTKI
ncbi:MAG: glycosyltransferase [Butyrivibrio sp.]|nr:glycosyltransferase [Butyrivibrio sp.]